MGFAFILCCASLGQYFCDNLEFIPFMATSRGLFGSSLARKYWMALTGLFLCSFLVVHLLGNLPLLTGNQETFNAYAHFMTTFPLIKAVSYLLYGSILLHTFDGLMLARQNMAARPAGYVKYHGAANANWSSRNMALLGTFTLLFLIIHMKSFWYEMHWGNVPMYTDADGAVYKDLYTITVAAFEQIWYSLFYVLAMISLGFHLWHGFASAFQTMGWSHPRYTPIIRALGYGFSVLVPATFASIPLYILLT
jgi:succinate dehydrogenase / fumarate reductase, cytochrome b subunit